MPKLRRPQREMELEEQLRDRYGGMMTLADICREIGVVKRQTGADFVAGVPKTKVGRACRWRTIDVAHRIYERTEYVQNN